MGRVVVIVQLARTCSIATSPIPSDRMTAEDGITERLAIKPN